jgi:hypothetical protein
MLTIASCLPPYLGSPFTLPLTVLLFPLSRKWKMSCGSGEYVRLMENYPLVTGG